MALETKVTAVKSGGQERLIATSSDTPIIEAYRRMRLAKVHHLMVLRGDDVVGMLSDRDIFENGLLESGNQLAEHLTVGDVMHDHLPVLTEEATLKDALAYMETHNVSGLPVMRDGKPYAVVTHSDVLRLLREILAGNEGFDRIEAEAKTVASHPLGIRLMELLNDIGL